MSEAATKPPSPPHRCRHHTSVQTSNNEQLLLRVQHAGDDSIERNVTLEAMLNRLEERMETTGGGVVDMPFLPCVNEGIIRCYILRDRCRGILHQLPLPTSDVESTSYPNLNVSKSKKYQTMLNLLCLLLFDFSSLSQLQIPFLGSLE